MVCRREGNSGSKLVCRLEEVRLLAPDFGEKLGAGGEVCRLPPKEIGESFRPSAENCWRRGALVGESGSAFGGVLPVDGLLSLSGNGSCTGIVLKERK